jgi:hypothetical protein
MSRKRIHGGFAFRLYGLAAAERKKYQKGLTPVSYAPPRISDGQ